MFANPIFFTELLGELQGGRENPLAPSKSQVRNIKEVWGWVSLHVGVNGTWIDRRSPGGGTKPSSRSGGVVSDKRITQRVKERIPLSRSENELESFW